MVYTLTSEDEGKRVRVRVTFTDDAGNSHTLTSFTTGTVQAQTSIPSDKVKVSLDATAYVVEEGKTLRITVTLAEAPEEDPVYIPFTVTPETGPAGPTSRPGPLTPGSCGSTWATPPIASTSTPTTTR